MNVPIQERSHKLLEFCFREPVEMEAVFRTAINWLESVGLPPNLMYTNYHSNCMTYPYKKAYSRLTKKGFAGLSTFHVFSVPEYLTDFEKYPSEFNEQFYVDIHCIQSEALQVAILNQSCEDQGFEELCRQLATFCRPAYGLRAVCRYGAWFRLDPTFVSDRYYAGGFMNQIQAWTLLNQHHLARKIEGVAFEQWVAKESNRGEITPYAGGSWLWTISPEQIRNILGPLAGANILFQPEKHYYAWEWPFAGRVWRGDLTRQEVAQLVIRHIQQDGQVPDPPRYEQVTYPNGATVWLADEAAVTRYLKEWGHPAANLPEPPPSEANTAEQWNGVMLESLGVKSGVDTTIVRVEDGRAVGLSETEAARLGGEKASGPETQASIACNHGREGV
jgi:hypothetical protein